MRQVYFIRHSIRDSRVHSENAPLTKEGTRLAEKLVPLFSEVAIQHIYASPYERAQATVRPLADYYNLPISEKSALRERAIGTWLADFDSFTAAQWQDFSYKLAGGEALAEVTLHMSQIFSEILATSSGNIIIAGHGTALACLFNEITSGKFAYQDFKRMQMPDIFVGEFSDEGKLLNFSPSLLANGLSK
ncbi:histidine phosphatase family protein [Enterococcus sp. HY326]|uniref:histidine phosphatase family protein n=1 Tax=Enterococcus sp. HY326 TaxID=2971265 RepID=UPI00224090AF|nr:histidine phosphatase family protein [Enterococcus sp. HY326]